MSLMDFVKKQFIDVIQWTAPGAGILAWRFPMQDTSLKNRDKLRRRRTT